MRGGTDALRAGKQNSSVADGLQTDCGLRDLQPQPLVLLHEHFLAGNTLTISRVTRKAFYFP